MKSVSASPALLEPTGRREASGFPSAASLTMLRAWYDGVPALAAAQRYLGIDAADGASARTLVSAVRKALARFARERHRQDLAGVFEHGAHQRMERSRAAVQAIETLRALPLPQPLIGDNVGQWLPARVARILEAQGLSTLAALTLRVPRRRRWWATIPGLGAAGARVVEAFFAEHPELTARARALVTGEGADVVPWERLQLPQLLDGSQGVFRGPLPTCALSATNDYQAVQAWLSLHEAAATVRAYRKEAERLILWAVVERGKALSSLATEDAVAYRGFLRQPTPRARWVGPAQPRSSLEWRPFAGPLSARSASYALAVIGAMFRWLVEQRYVLANPFAGVKVRGGSRTGALDAHRGFSTAEWALVRIVADGLEWSYGWDAPAAQRLRFILDFAYSTGLRSSELVGAKALAIEVDAQGDTWLSITGKGNKPGRVALPPLARAALDRYLVQRGLPVTAVRLAPTTPLLGSLVVEQEVGISASRLWAVLRRFFATAAKVIGETSPTTAEKLKRASPHWMRHTHATHALERGVDLTTVRDNLRHATVSTTSLYLHTDAAKRARQLGEAFGSN